MLARLLDHRELGVPALAERAGLSEGETRAVLDGGSPGEELLRRLAPALGLHTVDLFVLAGRAVDLFVLAGRAVPDSMAPLDAGAAMFVKWTVTDAVRVPAAGRRELLRRISELPQEERRSRFNPKPLLPLDGGPGAQVVRMLQYRNLAWSGMAAALALTTPTYLSSATYGVIGSGRKELTPPLVTDFAALLGIDAVDLAALTGVVLRAVPPPPPSRAVDAAALLWAARRLSAAQARHLSELARSLREDSSDAPDAGQRYAHD
jgi:hypothetical protein